MKVWDRDILKQKINDNSISWNQLTKGFGNKKNLLEEDCKITLNKATLMSLYYITHLYLNILIHLKPKL